MRGKRTLLLFLAVIFISAAGIQAQEAEWYQGKPIRDIVFNGLNSVKMTDLEGVIAPFIGRLYSDEVFWELQGRIWGLEFFDNVTPAAEPSGVPLGSEVLLKFNVTERPHISSIVFEGNIGLRRNELLDAITIKENDVVNEPRIRLDEQAIIAKYQEKGYPDVSVSSVTRASGRGGITLVFTIKEGQHTVIEAINFEGNTAFLSKRLASRLSLKTKGGLRSGAFSEAKLLADRATITSYYTERGYIDANVRDITRTSRQDDKGNNLLTITFHIVEGRAWQFGGVIFEGNEIFSSEELEKLITTKKDSVVNARRLESDLQRVADLYFENGYLFNSIGREEQRDPGSNTITYVVPIIERGRAHIENISVRGNRKTKDYVILREIPLEPGDIFSKTKVLEGIRNLYNLQFFSSILPETPPGSADQLMDLIINVEEQPTTDFQFGLTFSGSSDPDDFPVSGVLSLTNRNFMGTGNSLGGDINLSPQTQSGSVRYTQRWLLGLPLSGGFDFTIAHSKKTAYSDNLAPFFNGDEDFAFPDGFTSLGEYQSSYLADSDYLMTYEVFNLSLGFSTGYRWSTPYGNLGLSGGLRAGFNINSYNSDIYRPFDPKLRNKNNELVPFTQFSTTLSLDQRDIFYDPNRGYYLSQRIGFYGLLPGDIENEHYIRSDTKLEWFKTLLDIPLTESWTFHGVFGVHSGVSVIFPQLGLKIAQIEDANKVTADGMFIGRGWISERRHTGLALWENWAEVRIPLVSGFLAWDFFFDAVAIASEPQYIFSSDPIGSDHSLLNRMRFSMGGGFRFAIPQFPFRFLFTKRFRFENNEFKWQTGGLPGGLDFVLSFALSS